MGIVDERFAVLSGRAPATLGNEISDAIHKALSFGMEPDEAVSVALKVVIDYGEAAYGLERFEALKNLIDEYAKRA